MEQSNSTANSAETTTAANTLNSRKAYALFSAAGMEVASPVGNTVHLPDATNTTTATDAVRVHCVEITSQHLEKVQMLLVRPPTDRAAALKELSALRYEGKAVDTISQVKQQVQKYKAAELAAREEEQRAEEGEASNPLAGENNSAASEQGNCNDMNTNNKSVKENLSRQINDNINFYALKFLRGSSSKTNNTNVGNSRCEVALLPEDTPLETLANSDGTLLCQLHPSEQEMQAEGEGEHVQEFVLFYIAEEGANAYGMDDICCILAICAACIACCGALLCCGAMAAKNSNSGNNKKPNTNNNNNNNSNNYNNNNNAYNNTNPIQQQQPVYYQQQQQPQVNSYGAPPNATQPAPAATPSYYNYSQQPTAL